MSTAGVESIAVPRARAAHRRDDPPILQSPN